MQVVDLDPVGFVLVLADALADGAVAGFHELDQAAGGLATCWHCSVSSVKKSGILGKTRSNRRRKIEGWVLAHGLPPRNRLTRRRPGWRREAAPGMVTIQVVAMSWPGPAHGARSFRGADAHDRGGDDVGGGHRAPPSEAARMTAAEVSCEPRAWMGRTR